MGGWGHVEFAERSHTLWNKFNALSKTGESLRFLSSSIHGDDGVSALLSLQEFHQIM